MKKEEKRYTLCDTQIISSYEEYKEWCIANNEEPMEDDSEEYWNYVNEMQALEWDDLMLNLSYSRENDTDVLITGRLGLWNGKHEIYPVKMNSIKSAIEKCLSQNDHNVSVIMDNGVINVFTYHHDGVNCFEIHKLNRRGADKDEEFFYNRENIEKYFKKFSTYLF